MTRKERDFQNTRRGIYVYLVFFGLHLRSGNLKRKLISSILVSFVS